MSSTTSRLLCALLAAASTMTMESGFAHASTSSSETYIGYEALGCYTDNPSARLMSYMTSFSGMYAQKCFDICQGESPDYTHFGLQYRIECWCGVDTNPTRHGPQLDDSECDMTCATPSQICGGYNKMNVFAMKTFEGINPRVGCYADSIPRAMSATPKFASSDMTREMCQEHCSEAGTEFYGLEYGTECWCGDEYDTYGAAHWVSYDGTYIEYGDTYCEEDPCSGNTLDQCGGRWLLAVYRTDIPLNN